MSQNVIFKNHRNCSLRTSTKGRLYSEHSIAIHLISMAGYVTAVLAFVRAELCDRETISFWDFWKVTPCDLNPFLLILDSTKRLFVEMCLIRSTIAKLCPNMIHFHDLDFRVSRSEEVTSSFDAQCLWRNWIHNNNATFKDLQSSLASLRHGD